jgi:hypothetical protein
MAIDDLRRDPMMARLLDELDRGTDIGHYGRLVFAIVARWFLDEDELVAQLAKDRDFGETGARRLVAEVIDRGYSPPRREKILDYQSQQSFAIIEHPENPDLGNVYRDLTFPDALYDHIGAYREQQHAAHARD